MPLRSLHFPPMTADEIRRANDILHDTSLTHDERIRALGVLALKTRDRELAYDRGFGVQVPKSALESDRIPVDPTRFPHTCPRCGAPAYVGLASVECSDGCV